MSISVASCTIKENRLHLRRGLNRYPELCSPLLTANLRRRGRRSGRRFRRTRARLTFAWRKARIPIDEATPDCRWRVLRSGRTIRTGTPPRMMWQRKPSSNHRERTRFMSPFRRRQMSRAARRTLVPSAKLFAVTFFSGDLLSGFLHWLIASAGYGLAQLSSVKTDSIASECSTPRPS
jgi:hypothetical protein